MYNRYTFSLEEEFSNWWWLDGALCSSLPISVQHQFETSWFPESFLNKNFSLVSPSIAQSNLQLRSKYFTSILFIQSQFKIKKIKMSERSHRSNRSGGPYRSTWTARRLSVDLSDTTYTDISSEKKSFGKENWKSCFSNCIVKQRLYNIGICCCLGYDYNK